nr:MarR family transcriptional regulator [Deinobacterium chartae]
MTSDIHGADPSLSQVNTLFQLRDHGPMSVSQPTARIGFSLPATRQLLERLVVRGFVVRAENPKDRRQKQLALTHTPSPSSSFRP